MNKHLHTYPRLAIRLSAILLVPLAAFSQPAAQQASPATQQAANDQSVATLHMQAREVLLPVTVRDKHGALVTSLQQSDFTLTEDGRPQVIKSFTRETNLPFELGLLVDTSRSVSGAIEDERKAADKFVDQMLPDPKAGNGASGSAKPADASPTRKDEAFLLHFDREVELLQDFTTTRDKLHHEIEGMGPTSRSNNDSQGPETTGDDRDRQRGGNARGGTTLYDAIFLASDELMKPKDGRKALVVFSDGVDRGSKESMSEALDAAEHANVSVYTIYFKGEQERDSNGFPGGRRGGMGGGWPGGGGGYPGGGGRYPGGGGRRGGEPQVDGKKIMEKIATQTGGRYFEAKKKDNLEEIYGIIADELRGQYLLSYTPDKVDNDGGYHKVELKAKNGDLSVQTREGYYAPGGDK
jgi:VWFA-related protein